MLTNKVEGERLDLDVMLARDRGSLHNDMESKSVVIASREREFVKESGWVDTKGEERLNLEQRSVGVKERSANEESRGREAQSRRDVCQRQTIIASTTERVRSSQLYQRKNSLLEREIGLKGRKAWSRA